MKRFVPLLLLVTYSHGGELSKEEIHSQKEGLDRLSQLADRAFELPPDEAIKKLGEGVRKTARRSIYSIEGTKEVANKLKEALIAIPGHADYFSKEIERLRQDRTARATGSYERHRFWIIFETLGQIPSTETVGVLGELLSDMEWDRDPIEHIMSGADWTQTPPNGMLAAQALANLIESPPLQKDPEGYFESDVHPWQLWYEQVKAGTRTFRFKGDPQEYSLAGPVDQAREPATTRPAKPPVPAETGIAAEEPAGSGFSWPILLAALAVCGAGVWLVLRGRQPGPVVK